MRKEINIGLGEEGTDTEGTKVLSEVMQLTGEQINLLQQQEFEITNKQVLVINIPNHNSLVTLKKEEVRSSWGSGVILFIDIFKTELGTKFRIRLHDDTSFYSSKIFDTYEFENKFNNIVLPLVNTLSSAEENDYFSNEDREDICKFLTPVRSTENFDEKYKFDEDRIGVIEEIIKQLEEDRISSILSTEMNTLKIVDVNLLVDNIKNDLPLKFSDGDAFIEWLKSSLKIKIKVMNIYCYGDKYHEDFELGLEFELDLGKEGIPVYNVSDPRETVFYRRMNGNVSFDKDDDFSHDKDDFPNVLSSITTRLKDFIIKSITYVNRL